MAQEYDTCIIKVMSALKELEVVDKKVVAGNAKLDKQQSKLEKIKERINKAKEKELSDFARTSAKDLERMKEIADTVQMTPAQRQEFFNEYYRKQKMYQVQDVKNLIADKNLKVEFDRITNLPHLANSPKEILAHVVKQAELQEVSTTRKYVAILVNGLDKEGVKDFVSAHKKEVILDDLGKEIGTRRVYTNHAAIKQELRQLRDDGLGKPGITGNPEALKAAKVFRKYYNAIHADVESFGTNIGRIEGYTGYQNWDPASFADEAVTKESIIEEFLPYMDKGMYPDYYKTEDFESMLENFHKKMVGMSRGGVNDVLLGDVLAKKNTLDRMTEQRAIHLTAEGEDLLLAKYGQGNLLEDAFEYGSKMSKSSALITNFGPAPAAGFKDYQDLMLKKFAGKENLEADLNRANEIFLQYTNPGRHGTGSSSWEKGGDFVRSFVAGVKLKTSSAAKAVILDPVMFGGYAHTHLGENFLSAMPKFLSMVKDSSIDSKKTAEIMGNIFEISRKDQLLRLGVTTQSKGTAKFINGLHKITFMQMQQSRFQAGGRLYGSSLLAHAVENPDFINPKLKYLMKVYGVDESILEKLKTPGFISEVNGTKAINEMAILSDTTLKGSERAKLNLAINRFLNSSERGFTVPGSREASRWNIGTAGTPWGQVVRLFGMFKSYPIAAWNGILENKRFGAASVAEAGSSFEKMTGTYGPVAAQMAGLVTATYAAYALTQMGKGKTPEKMSPKLALEMISTSGALGLYGEAILTDWETNKGKTIVKNLAGPAISSIADIYEALQDVAIGGAFDKTKKRDATKLINLLVEMIPGTNTMGAKPLMDHVWGDALRDMHDPKWRQRERKRMRDNGQSYLFK